MNNRIERNYYLDQLIEKRAREKESPLTTKY